jgi:hypothetical protein
LEQKKKRKPYFLLVYARAYGVSPEATPALDLESNLCGSAANFTPGYGTLPGDRSLFDWASTPRWYSPRGHTRTELTAA